MATPVVVATNGRGIPVTEAASGTPMTVATNGRGIPIVVVPSRGIPAVIEGLAPPLVATPFFTDDFNRPDENLEVSPNWTLVLGGVTGSVAIRTNQLAIAVITESSFLSPDLGTADMYAQAVWQSNVAGSGFLTVRHTDNGNFVGVRFNTSPLPVGWQLYKRVAGTFTALPIAAQDAPIGKTVRLEVQGDNVRLLENGVEVIPPTPLDGAHAGVTTAGVVGRTAVTNPWIDDYETGTFV